MAPIKPAQVGGSPPNSLWRLQDAVGHVCTSSLGASWTLGMGTSWHLWWHKQLLDEAEWAGSGTAPAWDF